MDAEKILIVDDEERNIQLIEAMLMNEHYELTRAGSGEEALLQATRNPPDLILLDVMMAGINGMETCRRLKAIAALQRVPVVMVTALRDMKHRVMAMEAGADDFISKPVDLTELLVRVKSLLRIKRYQDDLLESRREIAEKNRQLQELEKVKEGLDIYRMEQAQLCLETQTADWRAVVADARERFEIKARVKCIALDFRSDVEEQVRIDRGLMGRVLGNLLENAIRHTPEGGRVECHSTLGGGNRRLRVEIRDSGPGLDPEYHERIFNKFEQVKMRHSGVSGLSGLGLAFCKMAVEAHGGRIWVESEGCGNGCAFKFEIPIAV